MARTPDPDQMKEAMWQPLSEDRKAAHRASIEAAVADSASSRRPLFRARRRLSVIAVAAALLALPAGIALAAEGTIPGDALYPVKRVTETVRSWLDDDVVAEHRVEELEELLVGDASSDRIADQLAVAAAEVDRLDPDHRLRDRLARVASDRLIQSDERDSIVAASTTTTVPSDRLPGPAPVDTTSTTAGTTTTAGTPGSGTTTTSVVDATTTTVTDRATVRVLGRVLAGPTCPVERFPPDPACEDQPVPGAVLVVNDNRGNEFTSTESNEEGRFRLRLEPGTYVLVPQPYDGLLGTAPAQEFVVEGEELELLVRYDTGIR